MDQTDEDVTKFEIGSFTTKNIQVARENTSLRTVHNIMEEHKISHVPVCDDKGTPIGMIAGTDVRAFYLSSEFDTLTADKIMQKNFLLCSPTTPLSKVTKDIIESHHCAAIVQRNESDALEIFTVYDALKALNQIFIAINKTLSSQRDKKS